MGALVVAPKDTTLLQEDCPGRWMGRAGGVRDLDDAWQFPVDRPIVPAQMLQSSAVLEILD